MQKQYFETAYRTGSDIWSHIPYMATVLSMLPTLPPDSLVLDIGSGRGMWAMKLASMGYRVLGIDYVPSVVDQVNKEITTSEKGISARFVTGDVRDIPFIDNSFHMVTDIGVLQHLVPLDWPIYIRELSRVVMSGGYVMSVTLSRETPRFLGFQPITATDASFEKFGVSYYFFEADEVTALFSYGNFVLMNQKIEFFDSRTDPGDRMGLVFSLFQKK